MGNRETFKELVEELESKVEEARNKGVEDDTADRRAKDARKGKKKKKGGDSGEDESGDDDEGKVKIQCVSKKDIFVVLASKSALFLDILLFSFSFYINIQFCFVKKKFLR